MSSVGTMLTQRRHVIIPTAPASFPLQNQRRRQKSSRHVAAVTSLSSCIIVEHSALTPASSTERCRRIGVRSGRTGKMTNGWRRNMGNVRSFVSNSMGGLRGRTNIASWIVAGTLAYFLWVKPAHDLKREHEERAALASSDPYRYMEKRKPMPDPQETGLMYGERRKIDHDQERVEKPDE